MTKVVIEIPTVARIACSGITDICDAGSPPSPPGPRCNLGRACRSAGQNRPRALLLGVHLGHDQQLSEVGVRRPKLMIHVNGAAVALGRIADTELDGVFFCLDPREPTGGALAWAHATRMATGHSRSL